MAVSSGATITSNLNRLAQFGANITDSHSCFVFLPPRFVNHSSESDESLVIAGHHSLCNDLLLDCSIRKGSGLIGWVAQHNQPIHVSPFEHDSRTLGMYRDDRQLKSFMGIPVTLNNPASSVPAIGVLACDSKKSFAFSKLQGKLLSELATEVATLVELLMQQQHARPYTSWSDFIQQCSQLTQMLGSGSVEIMRLKITNFSQLEHDLGSAYAVDLAQQLLRLVQQSLPPHFPHFQLPNGDFIVVLDNMLSSFYENKILALAEHIAREECQIQLAFNKQALRSRRVQFKSIEEAISHTGFDSNINSIELSGDDSYEYRRA